MAHSEMQRNGRILKKRLITFSVRLMNEAKMSWLTIPVCACEIWINLRKKNVHENLNKISGHIIVLLHHDKYFKSSRIFCSLLWKVYAWLAYRLEWDRRFATKEILWLFYFFTEPVMKSQFHQTPRNSLMVSDWNEKRAFRHPNPIIIHNCTSIIYVCSCSSISCTCKSQSTLI